MKNIFISLLLTGFVLQSSAQGTMQATSGANIKMVNNAFIVLDNMNVVNNGTFVQATGNGTTKFTGNTDVTVSGNSSITFAKLNIEKAISKKVTLLQNINVVEQVNFTLGILDVAASVLNLGTTGILNGETENSRIFTAGNGYVQVTNTVNAGPAANPGNLGAIITSAKSLGSVTIKRGHMLQPNVSGTTPGILRYYDILPANDAGLKATLRFSYFDAELNGITESSLELWKQNKSSWSNIGYNTRSTTSNYVEKTGINSFSRWTLSTGIQNGNHRTYDNSNIFSGKIPSLVIGKENLEIKDELSVWPNPVLRLVNITINVSGASTVNLKLYDAKGSLIIMRQEKLSSGKNFMSMDMSHLAAGTYNLIAEWGTGIKESKQLIKQ